MLPVNFSMLARWNWGIPENSDCGSGLIGLFLLNLNDLFAS